MLYFVSSLINYLQWCLPVLFLISTYVPTKYSSIQFKSFGVILNSLLSLSQNDLDPFPPPYNHSVDHYTLSVLGGIKIWGIFSFFLFLFPLSHSGLSFNGFLKIFFVSSFPSSPCFLFIFCTVFRLILQIRKPF